MPASVWSACGGPVVAEDAGVKGVVCTDGEGSFEHVLGTINV